MTDKRPAKAKQNTKNKKEPEDRKHIFRLKWFEKRHNELIAIAAIGSLIVTSILALLTFFSLAEVKRQRESITATRGGGLIWVALKGALGFGFSRCQVRPVLNRDPCAPDISHIYGSALRPSLLC